MSFLFDVAQNICNYLNANKNICVITPNKRTIDFLKKNIAQIIQKNIWSPDFLTLSDFISNNSDIKRIDDLKLTIELYKSFSIVAKDTLYLKNYDIDSFWSLGAILLSDFNDIDNYLVDIDKIFKNISENKQIIDQEQYLTDEQIEVLQNFFQNFSPEKITEQKQMFIELWNTIPKVYENYTNYLVNNKIGYYGLINKHFCSKLQKNEIIFSKYDIVLVVGFNALTKTEQFIFNYFQQNFTTKFYWDYSNFYIKNHKHEAGLFIRKNLKFFSDDLNTDRNIFLNNTNISVIDFPENIAQVKSISEILKKYKIDTQKTKTAVVLSTESLMQPLLHSISDQHKPINVTIGYPFKLTSIANFVMIWFDVLIKLLQNNRILVLDFLSLLKNNFVLGFLEHKIADIQSNMFTSSSIEAKKIIDISSQNYFLKLLFSEQVLTNPLVLVGNLAKIIEKLFYTANLTIIDKEAIFYFYNRMLEIQTIVEKEMHQTPPILTTRTLIRVLRHIINTLHIPFIGNSTDGLQITTILETRNLDFDNVIFFNFNEQIFPQKSVPNSLISQFIRKAYEMPINAYQDAIYAYLFYRLLHNAKNIIITYSNIATEKSAEKSRFLNQLEFETNINIKKLTYRETIEIAKKNDIIIEKDFKIMDFLDTYFSAKRISASFLTTYLYCQVQFYFKYIAQIPQEPIIFPKYEIDNLEFGNLLHKTLEYTYKPHTNEIISADIIDLLKKQIDNNLEKAIKDELTTKQLCGYNILIADVLKKYVENILEIDKKNTPFTIKSIEAKPFESVLEIENSTTKRKINLQAIIDRIDLKDNKIRIIDYKTGNVQTQINDIEKIFVSLTNQYKAYFQLLFYLYVYTNSTKEKFDVEPHVFSIKQLYNKSTQLTFNKEPIDKTHFVLKEFETMLKNLILEILDDKQPFAQTKLQANCTYCQYKSFCKK
mgnify:CR=1 FL=1